MDAQFVGHGLPGLIVADRAVHENPVQVENDAQRLAPDGPLHGLCGKFDFPSFHNDLHRRAPGDRKVNDLRGDLEVQSAGFERDGEGELLPLGGQAGDAVEVSVLVGNPSKSQDGGVPGIAGVGRVQPLHDIVRPVGDVEVDDLLEILEGLLFPVQQ